MKKERAELLVKLLKELATETRGRAIPAEIWFHLHPLLSLPAVEVFLTRNGGKEFLLTYRKDKHFDGFHVPGGFIFPHESMEESANRIAEDELGTKVKNLVIFGVKKWTSHPYGGGPLAVLVACEAVGKTQDGEWFFEPPRMIPQHLSYITAYFKWLENPTIVAIL